VVPRPVERAGDGAERAELRLGPLLRHVTETSATIWVETIRPCRVSVTILVEGRHRTCEAPTFSVLGHHYALVIVEGLPPAATIPYEVAIDGERCWPPPPGEIGGDLPVPVIRALDGSPYTILFGSCRAAGPHEPPYVLSPDEDKRGRGVDAFRAHGLRMLTQPPEEWPGLALMLGDQVYADDPSPRTKRRIRLRRRRQKVGQAPDHIAGGFEEYCSLYHEAWTPTIERWMLSVIPTAMIFDDHDMIDDWNISESWVAAIRREPWWQEHIVAGLMSYYVYQHLGNQSPAQIRAEGLLAALEAAGDGSQLLRAWALESERFTPVPGGYRLSHHRDLGDVRVIVVDARNGRVLDPANRQIVDADEWDWVREHAERPCRHLVLGSSLPVLVPGGLHDLQQWNEALCAGRWGRTVAGIAERIRRGIDLEDWAAFQVSFQRLVDTLAELAGRDDGPETITLLSGDIHFAYTATGTWRDDVAPGCRIAQIVSSPMRNALSRREGRVIRFAISRSGRVVGRWLRRSIGAESDRLTWELADGPVFANNLGLLDFEPGRPPRLRIEQARLDDAGAPVLATVVDRPL
jgi:hypothetical protein